MLCEALMFTYMNFLLWLQHFRGDENSVSSSGWGRERKKIVQYENARAEA